MKNLMVFIDNSYLVHETKRCGMKLYHKKLVSFLAKEAFIPYDLARAIVYCSIDPSAPEAHVRAHQSLYDTINQFPNFEVKRFNLKLIYGDKGQVEKKVEKGVDVALATDLVKYAHLNSFDVAILCTGDVDFVPAIEHVKNLGKEVFIASFVESSSRRLIDASLGWVSLTKNVAYLGEPNTQYCSNLYTKELERVPPAAVAIGGE